nr:uncharacterized protein LOC111414763 [Onthophagus taurus]
MTFSEMKPILECITDFTPLQHIFTKKYLTHPSSTEVGVKSSLKIYTDGSSRREGAGAGVFSYDLRLHVSEPLVRSGLKSMTRNELYVVMQPSQEPSFDRKLEFMEKKLLENYSGNDLMRKDAKQKLSIIKHQFKQRWLTARKIRNRFEKNNSDWLTGSIWLPNAGIKPGRPQKEFLESSERSKRRKTEDIRLKNVDELTYATQMKLRETGKVDASRVVKDLTKSPKRAKKYVTAMKKASDVQPRQLSPLRALSMFTEAGLTRAQYERVRETNKSFFPCYSILQRVKRECYPVQEAFRVTETCAEVELQKLMDHTASRLISHLKDAVEPLNNDEKQSLTLISKWGCDGSQQMQFKMKFENETESDSNIFQSSVVPLQLVYGQDKKILWQNPTPSSPRYCRPIRIRFIRESTDVTNEEIDYIKEHITTLSTTKFENTRIKHEILFTMVDGKVCNAATQTKSTMRCYICNATSSEFNDLAKSRLPKKENLSFGLSLLHARIRFFESMLHLAYKLPIKKWNVRLTIEEKKIIENRKKNIQENFKSQLGLLVDIPKANFGNTNDGNTSRRFFENYEIAASITGIDKNLIYRLKIILDTLCSGYNINIKRFQDYAQETAKLYVKLYNFYPMSPTLHKVLRHGAEVIKEVILPIGQLSEEAAEATEETSI